MKLLITTYPFDPSNVGELSNVSVFYNTVKRRYKREELIERFEEINPDFIIAGTEKYDSELLDYLPNLKLISRVGIGVNSVDLDECKKRNIIVTNTPNAPTNSVAELTICQIFNMLRGKSSMRGWCKPLGRELSNCNVGIIGAGRIGKKIITKLTTLKPKNIFINDIVGNDCISKEELLKKSDIVSINVPLTKETYNLITYDELKLMKKDACILNLSRGGIINEEDLYLWLNKNENFSAAIDVFENEPYGGKLMECENAYLTPHIASHTVESRSSMELSAIKEVTNFINNAPFNNKII